MRGVALAFWLSSAWAVAEPFCRSAACPCLPDAGACTCMAPCSLGCTRVPCDLVCFATTCTFEVISGGTAECGQGSTCQVTSGPNAVVDCEQAVRCTYDAGANVTLECQQATCRGALGPGATVVQENGGDVDLRLGDDAGVQCTGSGPCRVARARRSPVARPRRAT